MRFASLGSGSAGNSLIVEENQTRILLDCGFGLKETIFRLERLKTDPEKLSGIVVTHEHDDHAGGVFKLAQKYNVDVWLTHGTYKMVERFLPANPAFNLHLIDSQSAFTIQDIQVQPYTVPHDAREPVQFTFGNGKHKLGVLTDTGSSTPNIEQQLNDCDALVLECNHDLDMLMNGPYNWSLKKRVSGRLGHLDNSASAHILSKLSHTKLKHIIAAHLSEKNNLPRLAQTELANVLNCEQHWVGIADQEKGFEWRDIQA